MNYLMSILDNGTYNRNDAGSVREMLQPQQSLHLLQNYEHCSSPHEPSNRRMWQKIHQYS